jgi:exodeoxyribonuclease-3
MDVWRPGVKKTECGFTDEERNGFENILKAGFVDTYRHLYPKKRQYSWWSYKTRGRVDNRGWRIDYCLVSEESIDAVTDARIMDQVFGSDHCPVEIDLDLTKMCTDVEASKKKKKEEGV